MQSATWNELISLMIHYHREYQIDSFFLQDGQSWPILLESDADSIQGSSRIRDASSSTEISLYNLIEGVTVLENEESGYWTCMSVLDRGYPNPFLVKIARKLNEVNENILLCSSGTWSVACDNQPSGTAASGSSRVESFRIVATCLSG